MRVVDAPTSRRRWPIAVLVVVLLGLVLRGTGVLTVDFVRRLIQDPRATLLDRPLQAVDAQRHAIELPQLRIDMKFKEYERIVAKREEALRRGILHASDEDLVGAEITFEGHPVRVKMRLKGDWPDHFVTDKWSYRIKVRDGDTILGMRRFSIHHPAARNYLAEWAFLAHLRQEGVLVPRYGFVQVVFNGDDRGIFAYEEHFAKELLESQQRREGPVLKLEEGAFWQRRQRDHDAGLEWDVLDQDKLRSSAIAFFDASRLEEDPALRAQAQIASGLLAAFQRGDKLASEVFDVDLLARFLAVSRLWGANHGLFWHNLRFYYNGVTGRLEPISFDGEPWAWTPQDMQSTHIMRSVRRIQGDDGWFMWVHDALADETLARAYLRHLRRLCTPATIDSLRSTLGPELDDLLPTLRTEWLDLTDPLLPLASGVAFLSRALNPIDPARARVRVSGADRSIEVAAISELPIEILAVGDGGQEVALDEPRWLWGRLKLDPVEWSRIPWPETLADSTTAHLTIRVAESNETVRIEVGADLHDVDAVLPTSAVETELSNHPFLEQTDDRGFLRIRPGDWQVEGDLVLPPGVGLLADAGTTLRFGSDAVLLVRGPLRFEGTAEAPVRLLPSGEDWPGLLVLEAEAPSSWVHVEVRGTRSIERPGWTLPGGVTFFKSDVALTACHFEGHRGEDALNVMRAEVRMRDCSIGACVSDAFDGDFVTGSLLGCSFFEVGGDAVDVSGSHLEIVGLRTREVADKAISIGEDSFARVENPTFLGGSIGVASKDLSRVLLTGGSARGLRIGLAAYTKKSVFGPATIHASGFTIEDTVHPVLVHEGSTIDWNGDHFTGDKFDVRDLYATGILGN